MTDDPNNSKQTLAALRLMKEVEERLKDVPPTERRDMIEKMIKVEEERLAGKAVADKKDEKLAEIDRSIKISKENAEGLKLLARKFKQAGLGFGGLSTAAVGTIFSLPAAVFTLSDIFLTGGAIAAVTGICLGTGYIAKRGGKSFQKYAAELEEKRAEFLKALPAPGAAKVAPPAPAMLKLVGSFNAPAPDGNAATPSTQPKPQAPKS